MKFGTIQKKKFGTNTGAYSIVTSREYYDSQITLTDYESDLVISFFGKQNLHVGNVQSNKNLAAKSFRLYPTGETITLNVVFPKPEKGELRLYLSSRAGFKPNGGDVWFMFSKQETLWIGAMPEKVWRSKFSELKTDISDSVYQELLDETNPIRITRLKEHDIYARDRRIALKRMEQVNFSCEYDPKHNLFISRFSGRPYLEAHHLIPIGIQNDFSSSLDTVDNVCCLCPTCHRAIHHAEESTARKIITILAEKRKNTLERFQLNTPSLFSLYAIE
jgi:5-methylcytosine-specific restriction endonuclease McrA